MADGLRHYAKAEQEPKHPWRGVQQRHLGQVYTTNGGHAEGLQEGVYLDRMTGGETLLLFVVITGLWLLSESRWLKPFEQWVLC